MRFLKTLAIIALFACMYMAPAIAQENEGEKPVTLEDIKGKVEAMDEPFQTLQSDVSKLNKIKFSGYFQTQLEKSEAKGGIGTNPYDAANPSSNVLSQIRLRRGRVKLTYDGGLTQFVFQGDFTNGGFALKDLYLEITEPWMKYFTFTMGQFNRPNYEVEYSSSQRESMERSAVVRKLYPNERDLGAMLSFSPDNMFKLQLAAFNNTLGGPIANTTPSFRDYNYYYMARLTKEINIAEGLDIDLGVHARMGNVSSNSATFIASENNANTKSTMNVGDAVKRTWYGFEAQIYADLFGGTKILTEYIMGDDADNLTATPSAVRLRKFNGFYVMFVKSFDVDFLQDWQIAAKYDAYNPNTKIDASKIINTNDLAVNTLGFGIHNYSFSNIRISLWYDINKVATSTGTLAGGKDLMATAPVNNLMTLRFQYKF